MTTTKNIRLFKYLEFDLEADQTFQPKKSIVATVVDKINKIIHHNDQAVDISLADLKQYIGVFLTYMESIVDLVEFIVM